MDLDCVPMARRHTEGDSLQWCGIPMTLFAATYVEGVDSPFFTRGLLAEEPNVPLWSRRKRAKVFRIQSIFYNGMPIPVLASSPNEEPIFNGKVLENPVRLWALRDRSKLKALTAPAYGFSPFAIPAVTYTVTVGQLLDEIKRHLLEDVSSEDWSLWTLTEVLTNLHQRIIRFMMETGIIRQHLEESHSGADVDLPEDLLEIRRVAWNGIALVKTDQFVLDHGQSGWYTGDETPVSYIEEPKEPLTIQLVKNPTTTGTLGLTYIAPALNVLTEYGQRDAYLPVPAAFCPALKYGTMADMLMKEGEAHDPVRADYCQKRYEEGVQLAKLWIGALE